MLESSTTRIYALRDPRTGAIRYIGKSNDPQKRLRSHLRQSALNPKCHRECWLKGLLDVGLTPELIIIEACVRSEWQVRERFWIAHYRALGCDLVNGTDGGDGMENPGSETRARISKGVGDAHRGRQKSPEHRAKLRESLKKATEASRSAVSRAKAAASRTGLRPTGAARAKMSAAQRGRKRSSESIAKSAAARAKDYYLMSPDGEQFQVHNLSAFCRDRGLHRGNLLSLLVGRIQWCGGWRIWRPGQPAPPPPVPKSVRMAEKLKGRDLGPEWRAKISAARSMKFIITTPTGEEIQGTNLTAFCKEHGLNAQSMHRILKGQADQVKGWRIRRLENEEIT